MDQIKIHQIKVPDDSYFAEYWRIYIASFPLNERRTIVQHTVIFNKSDYCLSVYISDNLIIGFISYWTAVEYLFIEHLAISPEFRNRGLGNVVLKSFIESNPIPIILEIELPIDNTTRRRLRFYKSLGFSINDHNHYQPPYHKDEEPVPMKILSLPVTISDIIYQQFAGFQKETVMG